VEPSGHIEACIGMAFYCESTTIGVVRVITVVVAVAMICITIEYSILQ